MFSVEAICISYNLQSRGLWSGLFEEFEFDTSLLLWLRKKGVLIRVCFCVRVCLCVSVFPCFCTITQKGIDPGT